MRRLHPPTHSLNGSRHGTGPEWSTPDGPRHPSRNARQRGLRTALLSATLLLLLSGCALPRWPVDGTLSSPFGLRTSGFRIHIHKGVDIAVPTGTPVRAMSAGRVAFAGKSPGFGLVVILDHGPELQTLYAHLSEIRVRTGDHVEHRALLGLSGSTGRSSAPHVHFEIRRRGRPEDPVPLLGGPPPPPAS